MNQVFEVSGIVEAIGYRKHVCTGEDVHCAESARRKFKRAYPGRAASNIIALQLDRSWRNAHAQPEGSLEERVMDALPSGVTLRSAEIAQRLGEGDTKIVSNTLRRLKAKGLVSFQPVDSAGGHWGRV